MKPLRPLLTLLTIVVVLFSTILIHEVGHVVGGLVTGHAPKAMYVYPVLLDGGISFRPDLGEWGMDASRPAWVNVPGASGSLLFHCAGCLAGTLFTIFLYWRRDYVSSVFAALMSTVVAASSITWPGDLYWANTLYPPVGSIVLCFCVAVGLGLSAASMLHWEERKETS